VLAGFPTPAQWLTAWFKEWAVGVKRCVFFFVGAALRRRVEDLLVSFVEHGGVYGMLRHSAELRRIDNDGLGGEDAGADGGGDGPAWALPVDKRTLADRGSPTRTVVVQWYSHETSSKSGAAAPRGSEAAGAAASSKAHCLVDLDSGTVTALRPAPGGRRSAAAN